MVQNFLFVGITINTVWNKGTDEGGAGVTNMLFVIPPSFPIFTQPNFQGRMPMQPTSFAKTIFLACLCFLAGTTARGQSEDFTQDTAFFNQQKAAYQDWLGQYGIGKVLQVEGLKVNKGHISLHLSFVTPDPDSITAAWEGLKREFEANHPGSLEHLLFYKMVNLMEVWQSMADMQIYGVDAKGKEPGFFRGIYFEEGALKVVSSNAEFKIAE